MICSLPMTGMLFSAWQEIDAGVAPGAGVEVDRHPPLVAVVFPLRGERLARRAPRGPWDEPRVLDEVGQGGDPDEVAAFDVPVGLGRGQA